MKYLPFAATAIALMAFQPAHADAEAKAVIDNFDNTLLDVMKNAEKLGYKGRYEKLAPVLERTYDMPLMARISVGPQWTTLTPDQQKKVIEAFTTLSIATYASQFDGFGGESFQITGESPTGADNVVNTKMLRPKQDSIDLNYRMRKGAEGWRVIDVFLSGTISQLANYRSEFSSALRSGGGDAVIALINQKVAALQK
jgi:phospholipid transport system substrate-binding protein